MKHKTPEHLDAAARVKFLEMQKHDEFSAHQADNLAAYCAAWSRWRAAEAWLSGGDGQDRSVVTIRDDKGNVKSHGPSPQVTIAERSSKEMARLAKLLRLGQDGGA